MLSFFFLNLFLYLFLGVLGLRFCARAFSSCGKRGPLFIAVRGPLTILVLSYSGYVGDVVDSSYFKERWYGQCYIL